MNSYKLTFKNQRDKERAAAAIPHGCIADDTGRTTIYVWPEYLRGVKAALTDNRMLSKCTIKRV